MRSHDVGFARRDGDLCRAIDLERGAGEVVRGVVLIEQGGVVEDVLR